MLESSVADRDGNYTRLRTPGRIQAFGFMLALHPQTLRVLSFSENAAAELGLSQAELAGRALSELVDTASSMTEIREAASSEYPVFNNPVPVEIRGRRFDAVLHAHDGLILAELEALAPGAPARSDLDRLNDAAIGNMLVPETLEGLLKAGPEAIRAATNFDRVMLYQFDDGYRGQVIGEALRPGTDSFLGLFFPESDIGRPARQLYEENFCRYIPHIAGPTYRMMPAENPLTGKPLDMSHAALRGVAPCHVEYLSNMGVAASMSYSIITEGRLWGLFACHHHQPAQLSPVQRLVCEQIAMMFSAKLEQVNNPAEVLEEMERRRDAVLTHSPVCSADPLSHDWTASEEAELLSLVEAEGAAIYVDGQIGEIGTCPDMGPLHDYIQNDPDRFSRLLHMYDDAGLFHSHCISSVLPFGDSMRVQGSGVLAIPLSRDAKKYLLFFRPELVVKATWGGNPNELHGSNLQARYNPRRSFAAWKEDIRDRAAPWTRAQIGNAAALRDAIMR